MLSNYMLNLPNSCVIVWNFLNLAAPVSKMAATYFLLLLLGVCTIHCSGINSSCTQKEISTAYLDIAMEMITKAKFNIPSDFDCKQCLKDCRECPNDCPECPKTCPECPKCRKCPKTKPADCADVFNMGNSKSGVYEIWPMSRQMENKSIDVYCDMDTDGGVWTVIQRRGDFGSPKDYFFKDWKSYKEGFGRKKLDFWLGNDNIFFVTNQKLYSARFDLMDVEKNRRYAHYDAFWIDDEGRNYTLHISKYSGDAGDAMAYNNNEPFSAKDRNNDKVSGRNGAADKKGGWWYYGGGGHANLNGIYHKGKYQDRYDGVYWGQWKGWNESLEWTEIKIRPKHFRTSSTSQV